MNPYSGIITDLENKNHAQKSFALWEQKFQVMQSLCSHSLKMRGPGDWYVESTGIEIKDGPILESSYGNGKTPQEAIENHYEIYTSVKLPKTVVVNAHTSKRKEYIWTGFMWREL